MQAALTTLLEHPLSLALALLPLLFLLLRRRGESSSGVQPTRRAPAAINLDTAQALSVEELPDAMEAVREHLRDERLLEAGELFARVRRTQRETGAKVDTTCLPQLSAATLEYRHSVCLEALRELNSADGWRELKTGPDAARCFVQQGDGMLWAKTEAEMPIAAHLVVSVLRESQLYSRWYPRCVESTTLATTGRIDRLFRIAQALKVPLFGAISYDIILEAFGANVLSRGFFLACGRSAVQEGGHTFTRRTAHGTCQPPPGTRHTHTCHTSRVTCGTTWHACHVAHATRPRLYPRRKTGRRLSSHSRRRVAAAYRYRRCSSSSSRWRKGARAPCCR